MDLKRPSYQRTVRWTMPGPDGAISKISLADVILQRWKVGRRVLFYWTSGCVSKTERCFQKKNRSVWPSSSLKLSIWTIARRSRLLGWSDFGSKVYKIWLPTNDSFYKVTYSFWLCVRTRCFSICAPSFVAIVWCKWALWVIAFWARNTPQTVSLHSKGTYFSKVCLVIVTPNISAILIM